MTKLVSFWLNGRENWPRKGRNTLSFVSLFLSRRVVPFPRSSFVDFPRFNRFSAAFLLLFFFLSFFSRARNEILRQLSIVLGWFYEKFCVESIGWVKDRLELGTKPRSIWDRFGFCVRRWKIFNCTIFFLSFFLTNIIYIKRRHQFSVKFNSLV